MNESQKRLFFGFEVHSPWHRDLQAGRILNEACRHLTLAFLGWIDEQALMQILHSFPIPNFKVGFAGIFDKCLFLPKRHSKVVAWHVEWMDGCTTLKAYQSALIAWLKFHGLNPDERYEFLPHVTISRAPFEKNAWESNFTPSPMLIQNIHLYESVGNLVYKPKWTFPMIAPFNEIEHTADIAFEIHAQSLVQLQHHAFTALAFKFPQLIEFYQYMAIPASLDQIIATLNKVVAHADALGGCPFKAISYHGDISQDENGILAWEMIVDV